MERRIRFAWVWFVPLTLLLGASQVTRAAKPSYKLATSSEVTFKCFGKNVKDAAKGRFSVIKSHTQFDPRQLAKARGYVHVALASVTTEDETWDTFFRAAPFLGLAQFPHATFWLEKVRGASALQPDQWIQAKLVGQLEVHGVKRPRSLPARLHFAQAKGSEPELVQLRTRFSFKWKDHEVYIPSGAAEGFAGEGARVTVQLDLAR